MEIKTSVDLFDCTLQCTHIHTHTRSKLITNLASASLALSTFNQNQLNYSSAVVSWRPPLTAHTHPLACPCLPAYMPAWHSGIICYVFTLHSAPKISNKSNNDNYCRGSLLSLISARFTYACKSKGNFEWFMHNTQSHTHTHTYVYDLSMNECKMVADKQKLSPVLYIAVQ